MITDLSSVAGILIGIVVTWLYYRSANAVMVERLSERGRQTQQIETDLRAAHDQVELLLSERTALTAKVAEVSERLTISMQSATERQTAFEEAARVRLADLQKASAEKLASAEKAASDQCAAMQAAFDVQLRMAQQAAEEKLALLEDARQKLADAFQALSAEALKSNNQAFLQLARETLEKHQIQAKGDLETRQRAIEQLVQPIAESLGKVDQQIQELEKTRAGAYAGLSEQVKAMGEMQSKLQSETAHLVTALRAPQGRGRWGEIQLQRVVELSGMIERCDFDLQTSVDTEDGRLRPDLLVHLPMGKSIVVDAKVPLKAYLEATEATDDATREAKLKEHAIQLRSHMDRLAAKSYWAQFRPTPEFVVMFLPGESVFSAALQQDPSLLETGPLQGVLLATPTTLIALLKAVAYGWRQEAVAANAQRIADLGRELYSRICTLGGHFGDMRKHLDKAVEAYNKAVGSLEGRIFTSARRFKDLEAGTEQEMEVLEGIERATRALQVVEVMEVPV